MATLNPPLVPPLFTIPKNYNYKELFKKGNKQSVKKKFSSE
jgi:hypothetical protein